MKPAQGEVGEGCVENDAEKRVRGRHAIGALAVIGDDSQVHPVRAGLVEAHGQQRREQKAPTHKEDEGQTSLGGQGQIHTRGNRKCKMFLGKEANILL